MSNPNRSYGRRIFTQENMAAAMNNWPMVRMEPRWRGLQLVRGELKDGRGRVVIPQEEVPMIIQQEFESGPSGRDRLFSYLQTKYIGISKSAVSDYLARKESWQRRRPRKVKGVQHPMVFDAPLARVQVDLTQLAGPRSTLHRANDGFTYILTAMDHFSKYAWTRAIRHKTAEETAAAMASILDSMPGTPQSLQADNGNEFRGVFAELLDEYGVALIHSLPYSPTSQGLVERFNGTLKHHLAELMTLHHTRRWVDYLEEVTERYNSSKHSTTGVRPYDALYDEALQQRVETRTRKAAQRMQRNNPIAKNLPH